MIDSDKKSRRQRPMGPDGSHDVGSLPPTASALLSPASLWMPEYPGRSPWQVHAPFVFWLIGTLRPRTVVASGGDDGYAYLAVCQAIDRHGITTVCRGALRSSAGPLDKDAVAAAVAHHDARYGAFSVLLRDGSALDPQAFDPRSIDLLHLEGADDGPDAAEELERWSPILSDRSVVLVHGTNEGHPAAGPWRRLTAANPSFAFSHGDGMGVLAVGTQVEPVVNALIDGNLEPPTEQLMRTLYARLGTYISDKTARERIEDREVDLIAAIGDREAAAKEMSDLRDATLDNLTAVRAALAAKTSEAARLKDLAVARSVRLEQLESTRDANKPLVSAGASPAGAQQDAVPTVRPLDYARLLTPRALRGIAAMMLSRPSNALKVLRVARDSVLVRASGLFDLGWYLRAYPDVVSANADPVIHYLRFGADEERDPGPRFSTRAYLSANPDVALLGINPLVHYLRHGRAEGRLLGASATTGVREVSSSPVRDPVLRKFSDLKPLAVVNVPGDPRVTMITDTISGGSLFGGVATGIILSALVAQRMGADLRIVTRHHRPDRGNLRRVLAFHGVNLDRKVEFDFCDLHDPYARLDVSDADLFITTSWWTTTSAAQTLPSDRIVYLVQEDERLFYPVGDQSLRASEALSSPSIRYLVNSQLLYDHFVAEGFAALRDKGRWFEPAFPASRYYLDERRAERSNFVFYARPNHPRNLYYRGIEVIESAIHNGLFDPEAWSITFIGTDLEPVGFAHGIEPRLVKTLPLSQYAALMRATDLGLSLMLTPHPSYPPLDLAASGAVAVTNRFGRKTTLSRYSDNIICADPDVDSLVGALAEGVALAADRERRRSNWESSGLSRTWQASLDAVVEWLVDGG